MRLQLGEILGDERIGRRDWAHRGRPAIIRAEPDDRMIDAVAGKDCNRPVERQAAIDQALRDAARHLSRRAVSDHAPVCLALALGEKHALRRNARPMIEPVGRGERIGAQRMGERTSIIPSGRRSTITSGGPKVSFTRVIRYTLGARSRAGLEDRRSRSVGSYPHSDGQITHCALHSPSSRIWRSNSALDPRQRGIFARKAASSSRGAVSLAEEPAHACGRRACRAR